MNRLMIVFFLLCLPVTLMAGDSSIQIIKKAIAHYQKVSGVTASVSKSVKLALLDETKNSEGLFYFSKGLLRLEIQKPEESLIVMAKDVVWVVTPTSKELGGKTQVLKIKSNSKARSKKAPLVELLTNPKAWDFFKVKKLSHEANSEQIELVPKKPNTMAEIVSVTVFIDKNKNEILKLSYKDELENETTYGFKNIDFTSKVESKKFQYVPPSGAEVSEY